MVRRPQNKKEFQQSEAVTSLTPPSAKFIRTGSTLRMVYAGPGNDGQIWICKL